MDPTTDGVMKWFQAGGFIMYPLIFFSILTWTVILERVWVFRRLRPELDLFKRRVIELLEKKESAAAQMLCRERSALPSAAILLTGMERQAKVRSSQLVLAAMERRRQQANQELRRGLWMLGTIATAAPFVGLFGTVIGILRAFHEMARTGVGGFTVVAAGISEALIATAVGIAVAVVAALAFNALTTRASRLILQLRQDSEEIAEALVGLD